MLYRKITSYIEDHLKMFMKAEVPKVDNSEYLF